MTAVAPAATDEEIAAILAAYEALRPRPVVATVAEPPSTTWRFSGRWWNTGPLVRSHR